MSTLHFNRSTHTLSLFTVDGKRTPFDAYNNVDSHSRGPWPDGEFDFEYYNPHSGDGPDSAYGSHGILIFDVPDREGMGVHSGRASRPDGLGRVGAQHCTMGCIRTTDDAMKFIYSMHLKDPINSIKVE